MHYNHPADYELAWRNTLLLFSDIDVTCVIIHRIAKKISLLESSIFFCDKRKYSLIIKSGDAYTRDLFLTLQVHSQVATIAHYRKNT